MQRAALTKYISKNKFVNNLLTQPLTVEQTAKLASLHAAIQTGNIHDVIFSDEAAPALLLYSMCHEFLAFNPSMSAYIYLIALAQFTDSQRLKTNEVKSKRQIHMISLVSPDKTSLSGTGEHYVKHLVFKYKLTGITVDADALGKFILSLPPFEQYIQVIENYDANLYKNDVDTLLLAIRTNVPFFECRGSSNAFILPSVSLINHCLFLQSPEHVQMVFIHGRIKNATRHEWHLQHMNPVSVYLFEVTANMVSAHNYTCGPLPILVHDIGHVYWGSLLTRAERNSVLTIHMPFVATLKQQFTSERSQQSIDRLYDKLDDFDLTPVGRFYKPETRMVTYVSRIVHNNTCFFMQTSDKEKHPILSAVVKFTADKAKEANAKPVWQALHDKLIGKPTAAAFFAPAPLPVESAEPDTKKSKADEQPVATFGININQYC